jgi:predicted small secreted protein
MMPKVMIACAGLYLLALSGCANTVHGMKQDGVQTSHALDDATHRIARANAN